MDPVAHTLAGAALAETGLKYRSRYATATLLLGANLPDIDGIAHFWGSDFSLYFRRGWTHGVFALLVLPLLLASAVWLWHRWRGRLRSTAPPLNMPVIIVLSYLAVWFHPLLDWLNTYGIRLLMPIDGSWFYGDTLFIVDPWVWLLAATGVVLARSERYSAKAGWILLATMATALIISTDLAPLPVKIIWLGGVSAIILLRWRRPSPAFRLFVARSSFATLLVYICAAYGLARLAENLLPPEHEHALEVQANPVPGVPLAHRLVLVYEDSYRILAPDGDVVELPREQPNEIVQTAMQHDSVRGFMNWTRYPYWEIEETTDRWIVHFRDLRYVDPGSETPGIGYARVEVSRPP